MSAFKDQRTLMPRIHWKYSLLFPVALLMLFLTMLFNVQTRTEVFRLKIANSVTGAPINDVHVVIGEGVYITDEVGEVVVARPDDGTRIIVEADDFAAMTGQVTSNSGNRQALSLQPVPHEGTPTGRMPGKPVPNTASTMRYANWCVASPRFDRSTSHRFPGFREQATRGIDAGGRATIGFNGSSS